MKSHHYLTIIPIILTIIAAALCWQTIFSYSPGDPVLSKISQIKRAFEKTAKPIAVLNLTPLLQQQSLLSSELIDPKLTLPQTSRYPHAQVQLLQQYSTNCGKVPHLNPELALQKALIWAEFRCGATTKLPAAFYTTKPLMHISGKSYALLAYQTSQPASADKLLHHKNLLHIAEVLNMPAFQSPPLDLSPWQLQLLINGENQIVNKDVVFFLSPSSSSNRNRIYSIYPTQQWMDYLSRQKLTVIYGARFQPCLLKEGNVCWVENAYNKTFNIRLIAALIFFVVLMWGVALLNMLIRRVRLQKIDASQRLFTLQMLTHELRTPTAAMRLSIEAFRKNYDELPHASQKAFLQMCEELQRLDRLVDASKTYLSIDETISEIPLNELMVTIINSYEKPILFVPLVTDQTVKLNVYSLELCIRNLIDNALHHGTEPISVTLLRDSRYISIHIQDAGMSLFTPLKEMTKPFCKSQISRGLGLGLTIVQKLIISMHGELIFQPAPTRFTIRLRST